MRLLRIFVPACLVWLVASCAAPDQDVCSAAADHVAACVGAAVPPPAGECEGESADLARQVLATPCLELSAGDEGGGGKEDAQDNGGVLAICVGLAVPIVVTGEPEGSLCCFDYNCAGSLVCRDATCRPKSARGGACHRRNHCQRGLACVDDRCDTPRTVGQSCDANDACSPELLCGADELCAPPAAAGGECARDLDCDSGRCHLGHCANEVTEDGREPR